MVARCVACLEEVVGRAVVGFPRCLDVQRYTSLGRIDVATARVGEGRRAGDEGGPVARLLLHPGEPAASDLPFLTFAARSIAVEMGDQCAARSEDIPHVVRRGTSPVVAIVEVVVPVLPRGDGLLEREPHGGGDGVDALDLAGQLLPARVAQIEHAQVSPVGEQLALRYQGLGIEDQTERYLQRDTSRGGDGLMGVDQQGLAVQVVFAPPGHPHPQTVTGGGPGIGLLIGIYDHFVATERGAVLSHVHRVVQAPGLAGP